MNYNITCNQTQTRVHNVYIYGIYLFQEEAAVIKVTQEELGNVCHCGKILTTAKGLKIHQTKMKCFQKNQRQLDEEESLTETTTKAKVVSSNFISSTYKHILVNIFEFLELLKCSFIQHKH